ncbi:unnamed protein product [Symbiodinium natans]|uniref:C3H1-type domain-containing protein n=1 Tax=Symbiodinium natans TaxID=878477 RepID=A0A812V176_9DINO|nr:unnamed protein product [Symbiodinium natans]
MQMLQQPPQTEQANTPSSSEEDCSGEPAASSSEMAAPKSHARRLPPAVFITADGIDLQTLSDEELLKIVPRNGAGEVSSLGAFQHPDDCSPCLFWFRGICTKGIRCEYCHFKHTGQKAKKIRPSKSVRQQMKMLMQMTPYQ